MSDDNVFTRLKCYASTFKEIPEILATSEVSPKTLAHVCVYCLKRMLDLLRVFWLLLFLFCFGF